MRFSVALFVYLLVISGCRNNYPEIRISKNGKSYLVQDSLLISTPTGASISAIIVRDPEQQSPATAILFHTIYARPGRDLEYAINAVDQGYVGIVTYSRGKGLSQDSIIPYEFETNDTYDVIEWISKQTWSDGNVGMYGGSYVGFTQWAATKKMHPALKTIVPSAAAAPGIAEPMENGVVANFFYPWPHYVTNNRYLDTLLYGDNQRWINLYLDWYQQGIAYQKLDSLDGLPNKVFRKWLDHPVYDQYWQEMIPNNAEFANIDIPILTTTGYFDGGQIGALYYLRQHYAFSKNPDHYLVIGPYTHFGSQRIPEINVGGYEIDSVARINITDLIFDWFNYIFKNGEKPRILEDKINYQVMGANKWSHAPDPSEVANDTITFYLSTLTSEINWPFDSGNNDQDRHYTLTMSPPEKIEYLSQEIDFSDRSDDAQNNYFTPLVISDTLTVGNGFSFVSEPFGEDFEINGSYFGELKVEINKKDFDYSTVLYELTEEGKYFKLTLRNIGRASLARDLSHRELLHPDTLESIPLHNVRMTSKKIAKGSRLVLVLNGNKHPFDQINYGTGKDVSLETIEDATDPLIIKWHTGTHLKIPVLH